jgi:hypothetical protein
MTDSSWAVLLCKFSMDTSSTLPVSHYKDLFTGQGSGTFNMTDFFSDMSHGQLDLTKSQVFDWFSIPIKDKAEYDSFDVKNAADPNIMGSRLHLIDVVKKTAASQHIDLSKFAGLVICMNGPMDYFGQMGSMTAVFDSVNGLRPSVIGQEMGHGYGLDHSRRDGSPDDYKDPWDAMSTDGAAYEMPNAKYGSIGPGLNAWNMRSRGWLDESRVWKSSSANHDETFTLRPLVRRDLDGFLAAELPGGFLAEFRVREGWDGKIPRPAVLVHRFESNHSYLMPGNSSDDLVAGDSFGDPIPSSWPPEGLQTFRRLDVVSIDSHAKKAVLRFRSYGPSSVEYDPSEWIVGLINDSPGGILGRGGVRPIPLPYRDILLGLVAHQAAALVSGKQGVETQKAAFDMVSRVAQQELRRLEGTN